MNTLLVEMYESKQQIPVGYTTEDDGNGNLRVSYQGNWIATVRKPFVKNLISWHQNLPRK